MEAQIPDNATLEQLQKIKAEAEAKRQALEELAKVEAARKALEALKTPPKPTDAELAAAAKSAKEVAEAQLAIANAQKSLDALQDPAKGAAADQAAAVKAAKDLADAQTAASTAQKAQSEAALAAAKAKMGEIPASGYSGAVELGIGSGTAEAMLLGADAVNSVSAQMALRIKEDLKVGATLLLFPSASVPDFQALTAYNAQFNAIQAAVVLAQQTTSDKPEANAGVKLESVGTLGLSLDAINKVLAFAKTDYKFVGIDVASSDVMLVSALSRRLTKHGFKVEVPATFKAGLQSISNAVIAKSMQVYQWSAEAKRRIKLYEAAIVEMDKQLKAKPDDQALKDALQKIRESLLTWKGVSDAIDGWTKQLTGADDKGNVALAVVIRQAAIQQGLDAGAAMVVVQLHKVAGSAYTKKNIWSSLGANPFFVMGGAVAGYVALDGQSGQVLSSMLAPWHGGYHSVSSVEAEVNRENR